MLLLLNLFNTIKKLNFDAYYLDFSLHKRKLIEEKHFSEIIKCL